MKHDINDAWLRTVKPPAEGRVELRDSRTKGLVLRITSTGSATWSLRTQTQDGKHTRPKLGTWPAMGIADARKAARAALAAVEGGADPIQAKQDARAARKAKAEALSVADALAAWQAHGVARSKNPWSPRYAAEVARIATRDIEPALGKRKLGETTREDWTKLVAGKAKRAPAMAAALYRVASSFIGHAEAMGWVGEALLPRKGSAKLAPPPAARERVLTDAELAAVWKAADREPPKLRAFMRLLILTGARELEVADIAAGELDLAAGRWTIPGARTKNGIGYTVPLSPLAVAELRAIWPAEEPAADHRLLGRLKGSGFRGFGKLKARVDEAAPLPAWRWHDLRRTARTGMTRLGVARDHAEAAINHVSGRSKLERTYDRHDYAPEVINALTLWQGHVAGLVGRAAEVVTLAGRRRGAAGR